MGPCEFRSSERLEMESYQKNVVGRDLVHWCQAKPPTNEVTRVMRVARWVKKRAL